MTGVAMGKGGAIAKIAKIKLRRHEVYVHICSSICSGLVDASIKLGREYFACIAFRQRLLPECKRPENDLINVNIGARNVWSAHDLKQCIDELDLCKTFELVDRCTGIGRTPHPPVSFSTPCPPFPSCMPFSRNLQMGAIPTDFISCLRRKQPICNTLSKLAFRPIPFFILSSFVSPGSTP